MYVLYNTMQEHLCTRETRNFGPPPLVQKTASLDSKITYYYYPKDILKCQMSLYAITIRFFVRNVDIIISYCMYAQPLSFSFL